MGNDTALRKFETLCARYVYPTAPNTKDELIEFWQAGVEAGNENSNDIEILERISNRMQEDARNSKLYREYPALEAINDDLLSFEDMHVLSENADASIKKWHSYMSGLIEKNKTSGRILIKSYAAEYGGKLECRPSCVD